MFLRRLGFIFLLSLIGHKSSNLLPALGLEPDNEHAALFPGGKIHGDHLSPLSQSSQKVLLQLRPEQLLRRGGIHLGGDGLVGPDRLSGQGQGHLLSAGQMGGPYVAYFIIPLIGNSTVSIKIDPPTQQTQGPEGFLLPGVRFDLGCQGNFRLQAGDIIHVSGSSAEILNFFRRDGKGKHNRRVKSLMIIGAGRLTHYLLREIEQGSTKYHIKVLENNRKTAELLAQLHLNVEVVFADGSNYRSLEEEGISGYDCLIALTGIDEENILICMYAENHGMPATIAKVNRTQMLEILGEDRPGAVITPGNIIADTILRLIRAVIDTRGKDVEALYRLADNQVEALQFRVPAGSAIIGRKLMELPIKESVLIAAAITQDGRRLAPSGQTVFHEGDMIIVTTTDHSLRAIDDILRKE